MRLASYGTLAPGQSNHDQLAGLRGRWLAGRVRGTLLRDAWVVASGYPVLRLDPAGSEIELWLFESVDLPAHWPRLDAFEGADYRRVAARVETVEGGVEAWIYVSARD